MAGGIDWFRWHHGSVTDPKFKLVSRKSGASLPDVLAVWAYLLEQASASEQRGSIGEVDTDSIDCMFDFQPDETRTSCILAAMHERGLLGDGLVSRWEKRQPKRERADDNSTERSRAFREKKRQETPSDDGETPRNATQRQETPRGEESREEEKRGIPAFVAEDLKNSARKAHAGFENGEKPGSESESGAGLAGDAGSDSPIDPAKEAAAAMVLAGLEGVSDADPRLRALVAAGLTVAELSAAAAAAALSRPPKSLAWALTRAENRRRDGAAVGALPPTGGEASAGVDPDSQQAIEAEGVRLGVGPWERLLAGGISQPWPQYRARVLAARAEHAGGVAA